jgi:1-acyl-sn-glycerol-3-phosphate acyltransferase
MIMLFFRSLLFYALYAPLTIFFGTLSLFLLLLPQKLGRSLIVYWNASALFLLRWCCNIQYEVTGFTKVLDRPSIIVSNHQSTWETLFLQWYFRPISAVLKKQLLSIPFFGWGLKVTQPIAIDRGNAVQAFKQIISDGVARLKAGNNMLIFPEGTRMPPGGLGDYKRSSADIAKLAGAPLIPVAHNGGEHWLNKSLIKRPGIIQVVIGEPIIVGDKNTKIIMEEIKVWTQEQLAAMKK